METTRNNNYPCVQTILIETSNESIPMFETRLQFLEQNCFCSFLYPLFFFRAHSVQYNNEREREREREKYNAKIRIHMFQ